MTPFALFLAFSGALAGAIWLGILAMTALLEWLGFEATFGSIVIASCLLELVGYVILGWVGDIREECRKH